MKDILQDLIKTNIKVFSRTIKTFSTNLTLFFLGLVYTAILFVAVMGSQMFGIFASLIVYLLVAAVISDYLYIINQVIRNRKFDIEDFKIGFKAYFRKVYAFLFLYWVVQMGVEMFLTPVFSILSAPYMIFSINIFLIILLNAIPETIYQKHYSEGETLHYAIEFVKENAIDWFVPNVLLMGLLYLINTKLFTILNVINLSLLGTVIAIALTSGILGFGMIYRGYLFEILSSSTRKKRIFTYNMYKN